MSAFSLEVFAIPEKKITEYGLHCTWKSQTQERNPVILLVNFT